MPSGIYKILNKANNKFYIGSSDFIRRRWREHIVLLNSNKHYNSYLQNAWNKYGENTFEFSVIEYCDSKILIQKEQFWLDWFKPYDENIGYNISFVAGNCSGVKHSPEFGQKVRERRLGTRHTEETKAKMSKAHKGSIMPKEAIDKIIASKSVYGLNKDRVGIKYNKTNRIWCCPDGQKCRCHSCRTRKSDYVRKFREKKALQS